MMCGICVYCGKILNDVSKEICDKCEDETTSCEWCDNGIDTASVMSADMMMRFVRPVNYCPKCGRRLEETT